jgi:hypothetical protein
MNEILYLKTVLEPVGAKAPKFNSEYETFSIKRQEKQGFGLLCQAQGYPTPAFRWAQF